MLYPSRQVDDLDFCREDNNKHIKPSIDILPLELVEGQSDKVTYIGTDLPDTNLELFAFLKEKLDVFARTPSNITGVEPKVITY